MWYGMMSVKMLHVPSRERKYLLRGKHVVQPALPNPDAAARGRLLLRVIGLEVLVPEDTTCIHRSGTRGAEEDR